MNYNLPLLSCIHILSHCTVMRPNNYNYIKVVVIVIIFNNNDFFYELCGAFLELIYTSPPFIENNVKAATQVDRAVGICKKIGNGSDDETWPRFKLSLAYPAIS